VKQDSAGSAGSSRAGQSIDELSIQGLSRAPLLFDGAMGTELIRRGVQVGSCLEALNLDAGTAVAEIHREYRAAGADIITTNTLGANRFRLEAHGLSNRVREINAAGVERARQEARGAMVAGCVGPSGIHDFLPAEDALDAAFREQAEALAGVDLFSCETFADMTEVRAAVRAIDAVSDRPVLVQCTYLADGCTPLGLTPTEVVHALLDLPIAAIGVNCAVGDETVQRVIDELRQATELPLIAQPNAGQPVLVDGSWEYPVTPPAFAALANRILPKVAYFGSCCGTTPEYIRAVAEVRGV
jgi:methionine synthase I (cobalamin-dependent)